MNLTNRFKNRRLATLIVAASVTLLGACASKGINSVGELATARASVAQAESAGAVQLAPLDMLAARDKLGMAETAARAEHYTESRRLADEATAVAEVAERKSRAIKSARSVEELNRANSALEKEAMRKP